MRHQKAGRKFNRTSAHRQVMFSNMAASLCSSTSHPHHPAEGWKELRRVAGAADHPGQTDGVANRRLAFARLRDKGKQWAPCSPSWARATPQRPGGYMRILKCGFRAGDNAPMAYVELVDRPQAAE